MNWTCLHIYYWIIAIWKLKVDMDNMVCCCFLIYDVMSGPFFPYGCKMCNQLNVSLSPVTLFLFPSHSSILYPFSILQSNPSSIVKYWIYFGRFFVNIKLTLLLLISKSFCGTKAWSCSMGSDGAKYIVSDKLHMVENWEKSLEESEKDRNCRKAVGWSTTTCFPINCVGNSQLIALVLHINLW